MENLGSSYMPSPMAKAGSGHIARRKQEPQVVTSVKMPASLRQRAAVYKAMHGTSLQEMIVQGLGMWLDENERKQGK